MTSKKLSDNIDRGLWTDYGEGYVATAWYDLAAAAHSPGDLDDHDLGEYIIQYHDGEMPPFNAERFHNLDDLESAMRKVQPDLRKWKLTEMC